VYCVCIYVVYIHIYFALYASISFIPVFIFYFIFYFLFLCVWFIGAATATTNFPLGINKVSIYLEDEEEEERNKRRKKRKRKRKKGEMTSYRCKAFEEEGSATSSCVSAGCNALWSSEGPLTGMESVFLRKEALAL